MSKFIRVFTCLFALVFVGSAYGAGYTCPSYKKYTSCSSGYYMTYNGSYNSTAQVGNACTACTSGCTCAGGTAAPVCGTTCSAGTYWNGSSCATCTGGNYCPGFSNVQNPSTNYGLNACPNATTYKRVNGLSAAPFYNAKFRSADIENKTGLKAITECTSLAWYNAGDRAGLYEYVRYNSSTGKYENTESWSYMSAAPGWYLTTKTGCGAYAYYSEVKQCEAGYYCPGKTEVACNSSNQSTVHTTTFGRESCPAGKYCTAGVSAGTDCANWTYRSSTGGTAASSCTACPTATSGWTKASGTGWTSYSRCVQTKAATAVSSYCYSGQLKQTASSATTWGSTTISTALTAKAGAYVNGQTCSQCSGAVYQTTNGSTATSCTACPTATSGWTRATGNGWTSYSNCYQTKAATAVSSYCYSGQLKQTASSATTWGSSTISTAFTAKAGAYVNGQTCSQCSGAVYQTTNGSTATSCTACPTATSGWTRATGTGWTSYSSCYQTKTGTAISSYCYSGQLKQTATSATAWGSTTISTALTAKAGAYVNGQTCSQCSGAVYQTTNGSTATSCTSCPTATSGWTRATGTGWTSYSSCYQTKAASAVSSYCYSGQLKQTATSASAWGSSTISTPFTAKAGAYVNGQTCSQCSGAVYQTTNGSTATSCTACPTVTSGWTLGTGTGWTSYSSCNETKAYSSISSYCYSGQLKKTASSATAWGTATSTLTAKAGSIISGSGDSTTCSQCSGALYQPTNGSSATSCSSCPTATSGWTRATGTGWTAVTSCYQYQTPANCASGSVKQNATSTTAWGATTLNSTLKSKAGYYAGTTATSCTICPAGSYCAASATAPTACVKGAYSGAGASACTACGDGDNWGRTTTGTGQSSCNATCANDNNVNGWASAKWNSNNTVSNLCVANSCNADYYLKGANCASCDADTNGMFPHSSNGTTGGIDMCYVRKSEAAGHYVDGTEWIECPAATYNSGGDNVAHYGNTTEGAGWCTTCPANTYAAGTGNTSCTACLDNYTTYGDKTSEAACRILCQGGSYMKSARATECSDVGEGYWAASAYVTQGQVGTRNACPTGTTTIGYGKGADEAADCGRVLNVGGEKLYLRSAKKTSPALAVNIGGKTYYGNMSTESKKMTDGGSKSLKMNYNSATYSVYDDSGESYVPGGGNAISISPNLVANSIVPASVNDSGGVTAWSAKLSDGTAVAGNAMCSATTGTNGDVSASGFAPTGSGTGCWCQITAPAKGTKWVYATTLGDTCSSKCAYICANNMKGTSAKNVTYRTNLYETAGIKAQ